MDVSISYSVKIYYKVFIFVIKTNKLFCLALHIYRLMYGLYRIEYVIALIVMQKYVLGFKVLVVTQGSL